MSGLRSRQKGYRGEVLFKQAAQRVGFEAHRVPASGAAQGFKGDVRIRKDGREWLVEVKSRKQEFKKIYQLYFQLVKNTQNDLTSVYFPATAQCVDISTSLPAVLEGSMLYELVTSHGLYQSFKLTWGKIERMLRLVKEADMLAIKDNNMPWLFIKYKGPRYRNENTVSVP